MVSVFRSWSVWTRHGPSLARARLTRHVYPRPATHHCHIYSSSTNGTKSIESVYSSSRRITSRSNSEPSRCIDEGHTSSCSQNLFRRLPRPRNPAPDSFVAIVGQGVSGCQPRVNFSHRVLCHARVRMNGSLNGVGKEEGVRRSVDSGMFFEVVVASTSNLGIGMNGSIPWKLKKDLTFFKDLTSRVSSPSKQNAVIMGRKTWESIPSKFRPLPGRLNIILSRKMLNEKFCPDGVRTTDSLDSALKLVSSPPFSTSIERIFVIGGGQIYREAFNSPFCAVIHSTEIESKFECDTFMPPIDKNEFSLWSSSSPLFEHGIRYSFNTYIRNSLLVIDSERRTQKSKEFVSEQGASPPYSLPDLVLKSHEEYQYLNLVEDIIENGVMKGDRTGTGTLSKFGCQMTFNLRKNFPLLTTKRVFWRGVLEELLWFISGSTNAKILQEKGINIWNGNGSREYLDSIGLTDREECDLGPVYGFQWRHFGAKYTNMYADYRGQGVDQLSEVIRKIKSNPDDRRIILSAWNPSDLNLMALPPCHMFCQFYVANGELSSLMYQRSCDMGLGVPFNIASYSLLTCMIAQVCGLVPGNFTHVLGDTHVYLNHIEPLKKQLKNVPRVFPTLLINKSKTDIDAFVAEDFELVGYKPHNKIQMDMAV